MGNLQRPISPTSHDALANKLSAELEDKIRFAIIENCGSISFDKYMQMALYEPGLGYYNAGSHKFGEHGDFVTAPEISSLFSRCLAKQCQQVLSALSDQACILEIGPGSGVMAVDILRELESDNALPKSYYMLEPSADLKQRQQQKIDQEIPHLANKIMWLDRLPEETIEGIILANEVVDSMPIKRIIFADEIAECTVICADQTNKDKSFQWSTHSADAQLTKKLHTLLDTLTEDLPLPYIADLNFYIEPWLRSLNDILKKGMILISDYGYSRQDFFHPQRYMGSLLCHHHHRVHDDPFLYPGLQDITASVDWTTIAEAATNVGLQVAGFTTQAHFLMSCGLQQMLTEHTNNTTTERIRLTQQINQLILPGEMGEKFKFIGITKALDIALKGFELLDRRSVL